MFSRVIISLIACLSFVFFAQEQECYILTARQDGAGFFSIFNTVIGALDFIDKNNAQLVVDFGSNGFYYDESVGQNWWSYYFEPIFNNTKGSLIQKKFKQYEQIIFTLTSQFEMSPARGNELIAKYIRLKPQITQKIDSFVQNNFHNFYVIGIHYRGTDKSSEAPVVPYEHIYQEICSALQKNTSMPKKIFVATDDALFLAYIKEKFGEQVCAIDALRSKDEKPVHIYEKEKNYKKGEDALLDCILLSKTDLLIKMASNLSDVSLRFNPNIPVIYVNKSYSE